MAGDQQTQISGAGIGSGSGQPDASASGAGLNGSGSGAGANSGGSSAEGNPNEWAKAKNWLNDDGSFKVDELAKGYRDLEGKVGNMLTLPDDKATPEQRDAFHKKLGWPGEAKGYQFTKPADFKGYYSEEARDRWASAFNDARLTPQQAQSMHDMALKVQLEDVAKFDAGLVSAADAAQPAYVKEWGAPDSEGFNKMNQAAQTALTDPKLAGMTDWMKENGLVDKRGLFTTPWIGLLLAKHGASMMNDRLVNPAGGAGEVKGNPYQRFLADGKTQNPDFNMTKGAQLKRSDPERARQLWAQAGRDPKDFDVA